tara:strand:+ start:2193 stop:2609 length:417 start_codon:yes stop_codon:yes gene_type:complete
MSAGSRRCRRDKDLVCEKGLASSMAKLWIWDKLLTLMRRGDADAEFAGDRKDCAGEGCAATGAVDGAGRGAVPDGVGCCDCGRTLGLGGTSGGAWAVDDCESGSRGSGCCGCWAGVELLGGAPESVIETSAGGDTTRE